MNKLEAVHCNTQEQWDFCCKIFKYEVIKNQFIDDDTQQLGSNGNCISFHDGIKKDGFCHKDYCKENNFKIYSFEEWCELTNNYLNKKQENSMEKLMLDVLNKTYDNNLLRRKTVPLFMSNPGTGKTTIIKKFVADKKECKMVKITLSQRMPNEVVGMVMPDVKSGKLLVYDSHELSSLKDGDVLFFDEVFNGTLKQTLDAVLNLLEDRVLPSGKPLADVLIVAASNPQGLINLTPQIKERFIRYDLKFSKEEYQQYLKNKYGMPESISSHLCTLIGKEKFEQNEWNFTTPRSIEKAINQIGCDLESPYNDVILPFLNQKIVSPMDIKTLDIKKGSDVEFLQILKLIIKDNNNKLITNGNTKNNK